MIRSHPFTNRHSSHSFILPVLGHQPYSSSSRLTSTPAFCFDIDGVLKHGSIILDHAKMALAILNGQNSLHQKFPFILCTNGGGISELKRSLNLSHQLGLPITPNQLVQSHTIFTRFLDLYQHHPILVIGGSGHQARLIAQEYGFNHVYIPQDLLNWNPALWPFHKLSDLERQSSKIADFSHVKFKAIFVMHDPLDWGLAIQVAIDLLSSRDGIITDPIQPSPHPHLNHHHQIPIYFSNPDFLWANQFPRSRFGQGAFQIALRANFEHLMGRPLEAWTGGKPSKATYEFAHQLLLNIVKQDFNDQELGNVYMIGDNPASDIQGANNYGWSSVLVKTGVFKGEKLEDADYRPSALQDDVLGAVKWALQQEGIRG